MSSIPSSKMPHPHAPVGEQGAPGEQAGLAVPTVQKVPDTLTQSRTGGSTTLLALGAAAVAAIAIPLAVRYAPRPAKR